MEKVETPLDVLSRAATMVQQCPAYPASDSDGFETPSTASSGESEGDRTLSPEAPILAPSKELTGKWRRERRINARLPDYTSKAALRSQSFNERRATPNVPRTQRHSDGELSDELDDSTNLFVNGKGAPPQYPGPVRKPDEAPIDMRLRSRPAPPPYSRPSVIKTNDPPSGSLSMCDPVIDEHFRRSLGDNYMTLFKKNQETVLPGPKPNTLDRASSPILFKPEDTKPTKVIAMDVEDASLSVDDHFAKALGDTWKQIQTSRLKDTEQAPKGVDDHFSKALGDTWKKLQSSKLNIDTEEKKEATKIISRSGVVI